ncbi:MAG: alpha/beta hydrolase family protein [Elusimicrobiota bacterium]
MTTRLAAAVSLLLSSLSFGQTQELPSFDSVKESLKLEQARAEQAGAAQGPRDRSAWDITASPDGTKLRLRSQAGDEQPTYTLYLQFPKKAGGPVPLVFISPLPVKHRKSMLGYCEKTVIKRSMACAYLEADKSPWEMLDNMNAEDPQASVAALSAFRKTILNTIEASEIALDYLGSDARLDHEKTAAAGFSLGGIMASLMAQRDERIKTLVLMFSGADLADIVMTKKQGNKQWEAQLGHFRSGLAKATDIKSAESLKDYLEKELADVEPMQGVDAMRDLPTFMANPRKDELIPKNAVDAYRAAMQASGVLLSSYIVPLDFHVPTKRKMLMLTMFHLKSGIEAMHRLDSSGDFVLEHLNSLDR